MSVDSTYEYVGPTEKTYEKQNTISNVPAPPMPPPLPNWNSTKSTSNMIRSNSNRNSSDSLTDSIDMMDPVEDENNTESDSGLEVVEEPTLRPSEVRSRNTKSMSIISGNYHNCNLRKNEREITIQLCLLSNIQLIFSFVKLHS
jgi:hypothetical protein